MGPGEIEMFTADYWMLTLAGLAALVAIWALGSLMLGEARSALWGILVMLLGGFGAYLSASHAMRQDATDQVYAQVAGVVEKHPSLAPSLRRYLSDGRLSPSEARALGGEARAHQYEMRRYEQRHAERNARWERARMIALYGPGRS